MVQGGLAEANALFVPLGMFCISVSFPFAYTIYISQTCSVLLFSPFQNHFSGLLHRAVIVYRVDTDLYAIKSMST